MIANFDILEPIKIERSSDTDADSYIATFNDGWTKRIYAFEVRVAAKYKHREDDLNEYGIIRELARAYQRNRLEARKS